MAGSSSASVATAAAESNKGIWMPSSLLAAQLLELEAEGLIVEKTWRNAHGACPPQPKDDERVLFSAFLERGLSLPASAFFVEVLTHYGVQPHNLHHNSILELSCFTALCEGFLGIRPNLQLFRHFFHVRKNTLSSGGDLYVTGTVSLVLRRNATYPRVLVSESVRNWVPTSFYSKNVTAPRIAGLPVFSPGAATPIPSWEAAPEALSEANIKATSTSTIWCFAGWRDGFNLSSTMPC